MFVKFIQSSTQNMLQEIVIQKPPLISSFFCDKGYFYLLFKDNPSNARASKFMSNKINLI